MQAKAPSGATISTFHFDYEGEAKLRLESEITDHYNEVNTALHDHIAIKPLRVTLSGMVSESFASQSTVVGALNAIQGKLAQVPAYLGKYTPGVLQTMQSAVSQATNVVNQVNAQLQKIQSLASQVLGAFGVSGPTRQQAAYAKLYALMFNRNLFTLNTPWGQFPNMAIETLAFEQPEETKTWSRITVTLKQLTFTSTYTFSDPNLSTIIAQGNAEVVPQGNVTGTPADFGTVNGAAPAWYLT
jgi:hypothetical protein